MHASRTCKVILALLAIACLVLGGVLLQMRAQRAAAVGTLWGEYRHFLSEAGNRLGTDPASMSDEEAAVSYAEAKLCAMSAGRLVYAIGRPDNEAKLVTDTVLLLQKLTPEMMTDSETRHELYDGLMGYLAQLPADDAALPRLQSAYDLLCTLTADAA